MPLTRLPKMHIAQTVLVTLAARILVWWVKWRWQSRWKPSQRRDLGARMGQLRLGRWNGGFSWLGPLVKCMTSSFFGWMLRPMSERAFSRMR